MDKKKMMCSELAEQLIFEGYTMPNVSWYEYAETMRWDYYITVEELQEYANKHNIVLMDVYDE